MSDLKPISVWSLGYSPNPWKVVLIFEELGLPYEVKHIGMGELKQQPYLSLTPNGRVPTIEDPNTGITLWEVCQHFVYSATRTDLWLTRTKVWCHRRVPHRHV